MHLKVLYICQYLTIVIGESWKYISSTAKSLINKMLAYNSDQRLTSYQSLNDTWILANTSPDAKPTELNQLSLNNLQAFKVFFIPKY